MTRVEPRSASVDPTATDTPDSTVGHGEPLNEFFADDADYLAKFAEKRLLTDRFLRCYHESLHHYKNFYDDLEQVGNPDDCTEAFYFIPGFNGTPGQMRFGLPSLVKKFGHKLFMKSLCLQEFSSHLPTWMKYSELNLHRRRQKIVADLEAMSTRFPRVRVIVSSTGFYDFLAVHAQINRADCEHILYWVSCAPDHFDRPRLEKYFYALNGFTFAGNRWHAYPNQQQLRFINPECSTQKRWRHKPQRKTFFKDDLESRFFCFGLLWDYASSDCVSQMLQGNLDLYRAHGQPIELETHVLAATKDGFWDDSRPEVIQQTLDRFLVNPRVIFKETSHLWVVTPEHLTDLIG